MLNGPMLISRTEENRGKSLGIIGKVLIIFIYEIYSMTLEVSGFRSSVGRYN